MRLSVLPVLLGILLAPSAGAAAEPEPGWTACRRAIAAAEPGSGLPPGLLTAIALVETGRRGPGGRIEPWPWSWNAEGEPGTAPTREAAIAAVEALRAQGIRSIDVGCMQVNLLYHPEAFPALADGFEPATNIRYAARFLRDLHARTGNWTAAIAQYHSGEAERGLAYRRRVLLAQLGTAWGVGGTVPLPAAVTAGGLCAPGRVAALAIAAPAARRSAAARPRLVCRPAAHRATPG